MRMDRISEALVLVMLASLPALAQQTGATANENVTATAGGKQLSNSANGGSTANARSGSVRASGSTNAAAGTEMRPVNGELQSKLDSNSAKVGDEVVVKTTQAATTADGTVIPKGSRLVGHVTTVVAHSKESATSQLGIAFDRAELKGGQSLPVHSEIRSLTPPPSVASAGSVDTSMGPGTFGGGGMAGGGMGGGAVSGGGMGGARAGGGGGLLGGTVGAVGNSAGAAGSSVGAMANSSLRAPGNVAGDVAGNVGGTVQGVGSVAGNAAANTQARTTGVQGVMLAGDATGTASGMLSASKQNVHLDSGTMMVLGITSAR
jgi:hypothetical protein